MSETLTSQKVQRKAKEKSTGVAPGLVGLHSAGRKHGPRGPGVFPCTAHWGILLCNLWSGQGRLERQSRLGFPGTESQACGVQSGLLLPPICHSAQGVHYLSREALGCSCLGAGPELTEPFGA